MSNLSVILSAMGVGKMNYSPASNSFIGNAYTSQAGNTYFQSLRVSEQLLVKEDIGRGHTHTFLNGLSIYTHQGVLLADERYHCCYYSLETLRSKAVALLLSAMDKAAQRQSLRFDRHKLEQEVRKQVNQSISGPSNGQQYLLGF